MKNKGIRNIDLQNSIERRNIKNKNSNIDTNKSSTKMCDKTADAGLIFLDFSAPNRESRVMNNIPNRDLRLPLLKLRSLAQSHQ